MLHAISYGIPMKITAYEMVRHFHPNLHKLLLWSRILFQSLIQQVVTLLFGLFGLSFHFKDLYFVKPLLALTLLMYLLLLFTPYVLNLLYRWFPKLISVDWKMHLKDKLTVLLYAFLKYVAFATQLILWFRLFGINDFSLNTYALVGVYYLITSFVPRFFLGDLLAREGIALMLFSRGDGGDVLVLTAVFFHYYR